MDLEERYKLFNRIVTGIQIIEDRGIYYVYHDPSLLVLSESEIHYNKIYTKLIKDGVLTEDELLSIAEEKGVWNPVFEDQIKQAKERILSLKKELGGLRFKSLSKATHEKQIQTEDNLIHRLHKLKFGIVQNSAESIAKYEKYKWILFRCLTDESGNKIWDSWNKFQITDEKFINRILEKSIFKNDIQEKEIRELARTEPWRSSWVAACKIGDLFGKPLISLSDYQKALVNWSIIYDNVYESMDCPSSDVIENDLLLDNWLLEQGNKQKNKKSNTAMSNHDEIGIVVETPEDAEQVYKLNDFAGMSVLKSRQNTLEKKGTVSLLEMPDIKEKLKMQMNNQFKGKINGQQS